MNTERSNYSNLLRERICEIGVLFSTDFHWKEIFIREGFPWVEGWNGKLTGQYPMNTAPGWPLSGCAFGANLEADVFKWISSRDREALARLYDAFAARMACAADVTDTRKGAEEAEPPSLTAVCAICGEKCRPVRHHVCYFPEDVLIVCAPCHGKIHDGDPDLSEYAPEMSRAEFNLLDSVRRKRGVLPQDVEKDQVLVAMAKAIIGDRE